MADLILIVALLAIPFVLFLRAAWKQEERYRDRDARGESPRHRREDSAHSHWGGMGRPGR